MDHTVRITVQGGRVLVHHLTGTEDPDAELTPALQIGLAEGDTITVVDETPATP